MTENESKSINDITAEIKENPESSEDKVRQLISMCERDFDDAFDAASVLRVISKEAPTALTGLLGEISSVLSTVDDVHVRRNLVETINEVIEEYPEEGDAARSGLTEATRIRDDQYWESRPKDELKIIREGLDGWVRLANVGYQIPSEVISNAVGVSEVANSTTLHSIIDLLQKAVETESNDAHLALETLFALADADDKTIRESATVAIAQAVLNADIKNSAAAKVVLEENLSDVRKHREGRETVEKALQLLSEQN